MPGDDWPIYFTINNMQKLVAVSWYVSLGWEVLPVTVGTKRSQEEQQEQHNYANCNCDVPHLHLLHMLLLPPLQVTELTAFSHITCHTAVKGK